MTEYERLNEEVDRNTLANYFGELTSSLYVLAVKLKAFHWNIIGNQFFPLHVELDNQVEALLSFADGSAELIRQINDTSAPVGMRTMVERSFIEETFAVNLVTAEEILPVIVSDYSTMIEFCQKLIKRADEAGRQDLSDFAISVRQYLEKYKWQFSSAQGK